VLDGASTLIAAQRPVLMIELVEAFNPGVGRAPQRALRRTVVQRLLLEGWPKAYRRIRRGARSGRSAAADPEYVANFFFIPREKTERVLTRRRLALLFPRSIASSSVRQPGRGTFTNTAMLPGGCWFFHIIMWAAGILSQVNTLLMHGSMRRFEHELVRGARLLQVREVRALDALLAHPHIARIEGEVVAVVPAQNTTMPPRFTTRHETGKVCSPGCSNTISTSRLPVISQIALPNWRAFLQPRVVFGRVDRGHLAMKSCGLIGLKPELNTC